MSYISLRIWDKRRTSGAAFTDFKVCDECVGFSLEVGGSCAIAVSARGRGRRGETILFRAPDIDMIWHRRCCEREEERLTRDVQGAG